MSTNQCLQLVFIFQFASLIFAQVTSQLDLNKTELTPHLVKHGSVGTTVNKVKDIWKKQVMVQAPAIFQGMEAFFNKVFNNSLDEKQRYQEFMTRVLQVTSKISGSITKVALNDAQLHKDVEKVKFKRHALGHKETLVAPDYIGPGTWKVNDAYYDTDRYY